MPMTVAVVAPRISTSARNLATAINATCYRRVDGSYSNTRRVHQIINWGSSNEGVGRTAARLVADSGVINPPRAVNRAANKLSAFRTWENTEVPNLTFTTNRERAHGWLTSGQTDKVYCRTTLRGNSGEGIVVARNVGDVVQAPLYTLGIDIHHEFRFHVLDGVVFDGVRKAFRPDVPEEQRNRDIMNHAAGTIFVRSGPALERASRNQAMMRHCALAISTLGLDFGAVDVLVDRQGNHHIIEVNTACGLEGTTLERYQRAFTEKLNGNPITPWNLGEFNNQSVEESEEVSNMNINQAAVGMTVRFNPEAGNSIGSLTRGNDYIITRLGASVIYVRNNQGRIQGYQPRHFMPSVAPVAPPAPPAPTAPVAPVVFEGPSDGSIDTSNPPTSPLRVVRLSDESSVNVTGQAEFIGNSRRIETGTIVRIVEMLRGVDTGDVFLGVNIEGDTYRFISTSFGNGEVCVDDVPEVTAPTVGPRVLDINNNVLRVNDYVQVRNGAGGHNLAVGTLGQVTVVTDTRISIAVEGQGTTRIQPSRVGKITRADHQRLVAEARAVSQQTTTTFTIGGSSYRVASRDMEELHQVLRRFTV